MLVPRVDGRVVRAVLTKGDNNDLIVYLPGFGDTTWSTLPYLVAHHFPKKHGCSVIRMDFCSRNLSDRGVSLRDHVLDLQAVLTYARQHGIGNGTVHCIAHSMSAYALVTAAAYMPEKLSSLVLWEGSSPEGIDLKPILNLRRSWKGFWYSRDGFGLVIAKSYVRSVKEFNLARYACRAAAVPALVVAAGDDALREAADTYVQSLAPARRVDIKGAKHDLIADTEWTRALFAITGEWLEGGFRGI